MIQGKLLSFGDDLSEVFNIRKDVLVKELNIPDEEAFDDIDSRAIHVLVYEETSIKGTSQRDNRITVATGRIEYKEEGTCKISHIAVKKEYRNKKYGDFTVRMLLNRAFLAGVKEVSVFAPVDTIGFFEKIGFKLDVMSDKEGNLVNKMMIGPNDVRTLCKK